MGLSARLAPGAATKGFAPDMAIFGQNQKWSDLEKYSAIPITLVHDEILTKVLLQVITLSALDAYCGIALVYRAKH
jgi:hypothetical protein